MSYIPEVRTGGVEPPQREATGLQPAELAVAQRPHGMEGWLAGLEPAPAGITTPGASVYTTATTKAGTTGLEPAASRLTSECSARLSYAPERKVEGGIGSPQPETETLPSEGLLRSQLLPIGAPASACPHRHLLTGWPWRLIEASCTLGPALCTSPCSVTSLARPSAGQSWIARVGFEPTVSSS